MTRVLYLYAVLPRAPRGTRLRGLAREPVRFVRSGRLVVAVGEVAAPPAPRLENLKTHDRVVRRLASVTRAALPARFGSLAPTADALHAALRPRARVLLRALARVANREQMTLHVRTPRDGGRDADGPGTRHLRRIAARDPRTHADVRRLLEELRPLVHDEQVDLAPDEAGDGRVHHLVDRGSAARYRARVKRAARAQPGLQVRCSGPWLPYSFAGEAAP